MRLRPTVLVLLAAVAVTVLATDVPARPAAAADSAPVVSGPLTGGRFGRPFFPSLVRLAAYGYTETEYLVSGIARAYGATRPPAPYTTRILVYRPSDPHRFNGTAFVEWNNVTLQADVPVEFTWAYPQIFATGAAYVEVTAQQVGVCGPGLSGSAASLCNPLSLKGADPVRYRRLVPPG